eukprot:767009-Hanusia_phi.AAC.12
MALGWITSSSISTLQKVFLSDPVNVILTFAAVQLLNHYFDTQQAAARRHMRVENLLKQQKYAEKFLQGRAKRDMPLYLIINDFIMDILALPNLKSIRNGHYTHLHSEAVYSYHTVLLNYESEYSTGVFGHLACGQQSMDDRFSLFSLDPKLNLKTSTYEIEGSVSELRANFFKSGSLTEFCLAAESESWIEIDLGEGYGLIPTCYELFHGKADSSDALTSWKFQASHNAKQWRTLREHRNDLRIKEGFQKITSNLHYIKDVSENLTAFRYFRLIMTGSNSSGRDHLCISKIELFGRFVAMKRQYTSQHEAAAKVIQIFYRSYRMSAMQAEAASQELKQEHEQSLQKVTLELTESEPPTESEMEGSSGSFPETPSPAEVLEEEAICPDPPIPTSMAVSTDRSSATLTLTGLFLEPYGENELKTQDAPTKLFVRPYATISTREWRKWQSILSQIEEDDDYKHLSYLKHGIVCLRTCFREWRILSARKALIFKRRYLKQWRWVTNRTPDDFLRLKLNSLKLDSHGRTDEFQVTSLTWNPVIDSTDLGDDTKYWSDIQDVEIHYADIRPERPKGILHWMGTNGYRHEWVNPAVKDSFRFMRVHLSSSGSILEDHIISLLDRPRRSDVSFVTKNVAGSWICFDFGPQISIFPSSYYMERGPVDTANHLRSWDLQGSNDSQKWLTLRAHINDETLKRPSQGANFKILEHAPSISKLNMTFRYLRVMLTGVNSSGNHVISLSAIEFFGRIKFNPKDDVPTQILAKESGATADRRLPGELTNIAHLQYHHDFDERGVIYFLGTRRTAFINPARRGIVDVFHSDQPHPMCEGDVHDLVGRDVVDMYTSDAPLSWVSVYLGTGRQLVPARYTLRHGFSTAAMMIRSVLYVCVAF